MSSDGSSTADNAQLHPMQQCSIRPEPVRPEQTTPVDEGCELSGRQATDDRGSHEPERRKVRMEESLNEVIEVPARGRGKKVQRTPQQLHAMDDAVVERVSEEEYQRAMAPWGGARDAEVVIEGFGEEAEDAPDELDLPEVSPEEVTDDEVFSERDFEAIEKAFPADDDPFWEVEDTVDVGEEEAPRRRVLRDPGEPTMQEWEEHRIDHRGVTWSPRCKATSPARWVNTLAHEVLNSISLPMASVAEGGSTSQPRRQPVMRKLLEKLWATIKRSSGSAMSKKLGAQCCGAGS